MTRYLLIITLLLATCLIAGTSSVFIDLEAIDGIVNRNLFGIYEGNSACLPQLATCDSAYPYADDEGITLDNALVDMLDRHGITNWRYGCGEICVPKNRTISFYEDTLGIERKYFLWHERSLYEMIHSADTLGIDMILTHAGGWQEDCYNLAIIDADTLSYDSTLYDGEYVYYYEHEIENFVKPFMMLLHYLYHPYSSWDTTTLANKMATLRSLQGYEAIEHSDAVKYIILCNDGAHGVWHSDGIEYNFPKTPGRYVDEENFDSFMDAVHHDEEIAKKIAQNHRRANTYMRLFKMCKDSLLVSYPDIDIDFSPNFLNFGPREKWFNSDSTSSEYRYYGSRYIWSETVVKHADSVSKIDGTTPYTEHFSGNFGHYFSWTPINPDNFYPDSCADCSVDSETCKDFFNNRYTYKGRLDNTVFGSDTFAGPNTNQLIKMNKFTHIAHVIHEHSGFPYAPSCNIENMNSYIRDSIGVKNMRPFGMTEWRTWANNACTPNQCGIMFEQNLSHALATNEVIKGFMRKYDFEDKSRFPDILYACHQNYNNNIWNWGMIHGWDMDNCYRWTTARTDLPFSSCIPDSFYTVDYPSDNQSSSVIKAGDPVHRYPTSYLYELYSKHFGDYLLEYDESLIVIDTSLAGWDIPQISVNPSISNDGNIKAILMNRHLDSMRILEIKLQTNLNFRDSIPVKTYLLTADYDRWYKRLNSKWGLPADSIWVHSAYINNNIPQHWACSSYVELVKLDSVTTDSIVYVIDTLRDTVYYAWAEDSFVTVLNRNKSLFIDMPKHTFAAVEIYPKIDSLAITLNAGWNLVSVPMYTGNRTLDEIFSERIVGVDTAGLYWYDIDNQDYKNVEDEQNVHGRSYNVYSALPTSFIVEGVRINYYETPIEKGIFHDTTTTETSDYPSHYTGFNFISSVWDTEHKNKIHYQNDLVSWSYLYYLESDIDGWLFLPIDSLLEKPTGYVLFTIGPPDSSETVCFPHDTTTTESFDFLRFARGISSLPNPPKLIDSLTQPIPPDTLSFKLTFTDTIVTALDADVNPVENALILWGNNNWYDYAITDSTGSVSDSTIGINDSVFIMVHKPGYIEQLVLHHGNISGENVLPPCDILVTGDITIPDQATLTALPSTNIIIDTVDAYDSTATGPSIIVKGTFEVIGTANDSVNFTSLSPDTSRERWHGIVLDDGGTANIEYAKIEKSKYAVTFDSDSCVLNLSSTRVVITNCPIFNTKYGALSINLNDCEISDYETYGMQLNGNGSSEITLRGCTFDGGNKNIDIAGNDFEIWDCTFKNAENYGIYFTNKTSHTLSIHRSFIDSTAVGILLDRAGEIWLGDTTSADSLMGNAIHNCSTYYIRNTTANDTIYAQNVFWDDSTAPSTSKFQSDYGAPIIYTPWAGYNAHDCRSDHVHCVPCEYASIDSAITIAATDTVDTVYIFKGTFDENGIDVDKAIWIEGSGIDSTIIDGHMQSPRIFTTDALSSGDTVYVSNLTIKNGLDLYVGGGGYEIDDISGVVDLSYVKFDHCSSGTKAGALLNDNSIVKIDNCEFINNRTENNAGAIWAEDKNNGLTITNSIFTGNRGRGGGALRTYQMDSVYIENCVFDTDSAYHPSNGAVGGAVYLDYADYSEIKYCTFYNIYTKNPYTGAVYLTRDSDNSTVLGNIFYNCSPNSTDNEIYAYSTNFDLVYCNIDTSKILLQSGAVVDTFVAIQDTNPYFMDASGGDFRLSDSSSMIDAVADSIFGNAPSTDIAGTTRDSLPDIGAYEYPDGGYKILVPQYDTGKQHIPQVAEIISIVPNPFNSTVSIEYHVEHSGNVKVEIYSSDGKYITTLVDRNTDAGTYKTIWDAHDANNRLVTTGVYLIRTSHDNKRTDSKTITLIK